VKRNLLKKQAHLDSNMKKVVVTGGAGFIGSHLVDELLKLEYEVHVIDDLSTGKIENIDNRATLYNIDISKAPQTRLDSIVKGAEYVFHLAAKTAVQESLTNPELYEQINCLGLLKILNSAQSANVKRFIFSSSSSIYGDSNRIPTSEDLSTPDPFSPYALTKLVGEEYCKLFSKVFNLDTVSLRYFNVYGDRMNNEGGYKLLFPIFKELKQKGLSLTINNDGEQRRDFIHVKDVVRANIIAASKNEKITGNVFNIGTGKNYSVNEIASMFGGERTYVEGVIEPKETLADTSKSDLELDFRSKYSLEDWLTKWIIT